MMACVESEINLLIDEVMADDVAMKEEQELEALLGSLVPDQRPVVMHGKETDSLLLEMNAINQVSTTPPLSGQGSSETPYGSDDDEYDEIFMDVIHVENRMASQQPLPEYLDDQEMMDMS